MREVKVMVKGRRGVLTLPQGGAPAFGGYPGHGVGRAVPRATEKAPPRRSQREVIEAALETARALWPACFSQPVPLRVYSHLRMRVPVRDALVAQGFHAKQANRAAAALLKEWCARPEYKAALAAPGAVRLDLDGAVACPVSEAHAAAARG